jgi:hypothetical protein
MAFLTNLKSAEIIGKLKALNSAATGCFYLGKILKA